MTPFYQDDSVTLYCGNALEVMADLPEDFAAVIADPPYDETALQWDKWPQGWPALAAQKSRQLWCFGSFRMFWQRQSEFQKWKLAQEIVWEKHNGSGPCVDRFLRVHELAAHFYQGRWSELYHETPKMGGEIRKGLLRRKASPSHTGKYAQQAYGYTGQRLMRSVIKVQSTHGQAVHPTQKPEGIVEPLVLYSSPVGGCILDCFAGAGTTGAVAKRLGRRAVLIEANERYCELAARRLAEIQNPKSKL